MPESPISRSTPEAGDRAEANILRLAEVSFTRLEALDRERTVVIFAVSPLEEHGPHLPIGTDILNAEFFNAELARRIAVEKPGWTVVLGPSVPVGASAFDRAGTLLVRARTVRNVALEYGAALARHGFRYILVTNGHGGPRHVVALEEAAAVVTRRYDARMLSISGPILWKFLRGRFNRRLEPLLGRRLTTDEREAMRGDAHAGLWETSLLLRTHARLVDPLFKSLPPMRFTLLDVFRKNYPLRLGNQMGYIGSPAAATVEFGEAARQVLAEASWELVRPVLEVSDDSWQTTSWLYSLPFMRTSFPYLAAGAGFILLAALAMWLVR